MNIIGKSIIAAAAYALLESIIGEEPIGIGNDNVFDDFLVSGSDYADMTSLKQAITRNINAITDGCEGFKIGKTGDPGNRANAYRQYSAMYLLCRGSRSDIEVLEAYYNDKYHGHPRNDNQRRGSAGIMSNSHHRYYLYVVVR